MKVVGAEFAAFSLPLRRPLATAVGEVRFRRGFVLRLHGESAIVGLGEASPATWLGGEQLDETEACLRTIIENGGNVSTAGLSAASAAALDCARLDLEARARGLPACICLGGSPPPPMPLAALLGESSLETLAAELDGVLAEGCRTVKLKVGRRLAEDRARVELLRRRAGASVDIRLDANRAWDFTEALQAFEAFAPFAPEFVEEPLRSGDAEELARLRARTNVAIAADESVRSLGDLERFIAAGAADAVVLKLARLGGPRQALAMGIRARTAGLRVVVGDSLETAIGRSAALHVAAALDDRPCAVGLGGGWLLGEDVSGDLRSTGAVTPQGPGLGVALAPEFERRLHWHG